MSALRKVRLRVGAGTAKPGAAIGQVSEASIYRNLSSSYSFQSISTYSYPIHILTYPIYSVCFYINKALGPLGLNMMDFCKAFNAQTSHISPDTPMGVELTAYSNRTFTFLVKSPPTSYFLKKCAQVGKYPNPVL